MDFRSDKNMYSEKSMYVVLFGFSTDLFPTPLFCSSELEEAIRFAQKETEKQERRWGKERISIRVDRYETCWNSKTDSNVIYFPERGSLSEAMIHDTET